MGNTRCLRVRGIDISEAGARVQADEPIDPRSHVFVEAEEYNLIFSASVRYCTRLGSKYLVGLKFSCAA
jgi:positive regulator of sigma E activity